MSRFDQRFAEHSVSETLTSLREAVVDLPPEFVEQVEEAHPGTLDGIHGHVDQALQAVSNLTTNPTTYAANLEQAVESAIQAAATLASASAGFVKGAQEIGRRSGGFPRWGRRVERHVRG